jgi:hypothetical protein
MFVTLLGILAIIMILAFPDKNKPSFWVRLKRFFRSVEISNEVDGDMSFDDFTSDTSDNS